MQVNFNNQNTNQQINFQRFYKVKNCGKLIDEDIIFPLFQIEDNLKMMRITKGGSPFGYFVNQAIQKTAQTLDVSASWVVQNAQNHGLLKSLDTKTNWIVTDTDTHKKILNYMTYKRNVPFAFNNIINYLKGPSDRIKNAPYLREIEISEIAAKHEEGKFNEFAKKNGILEFESYYDFLNYIKNELIKNNKSK